MSARIHVGVVDAHPLFRAGVIYTLALAGQFEVVAEGASQGDALRIAAENAPHVLLFDPHSDFSVESIRRLAAEFPATRTLLFTVVAKEDQVVAALRAGAAGYLLKGASGTDLAESISRVHSGERYVDPALGWMLLSKTVQGHVKPDRFATLTLREEQVLDCLTRGLSNKEIARQLDISDKTVKHYVTKLFDKLEVRNRVEAAMLAQSRPRAKTEGNVIA